MVFYIGFEFSLLCILYFLVGFGSQPERLLAGVYMGVYTMVFSTPFFA